MTRLPWMKFHKSDWLGEPSLKNYDSPYPTP